MNTIFGPSWLPKIGAIISAIGLAIRKHPNVSVSAWADALEALGLGVIGLTVRQNNVSSEQAGAKSEDPAAAAGAGALKLIPFAFLLAAIFTGLGCATVFTTKNIATVAGEAAHAGGIYEIQSDPGSRAAFVVARDALRGLIESKDYDPAHFAKALQSLHIKELKSKDATILVSAAVILWEPYASKLTSMDEEQKVLPVLVAVEDGLTRALNETETTNP